MHYRNNCTNNFSDISDKYIKPIRHIYTMRERYSSIKSL